MRRWMCACPALAMLATTARGTPHLDLGPSPVGVTVDARIQYYDVNAGSLVELRRALMTERPRGSGERRWAAVTSWRMVWSYHYVGSITCVIENTQVLVQSVITFPRWNPTSSPDSALAEWWFQYRAGLAEHERGHAQLAVQAAGSIVGALNGMSGRACGALGQRANTVGGRINIEMEGAQAEYDLRTRHGATQIIQATRLRNPEPNTHP